MGKKPSLYEPLATQLIAENIKHGSVFWRNDVLKVAISREWTLSNRLLYILRDDNHYI